MRKIKTKAYYKHDNDKITELKQTFNPVDSFRWKEEGQPIIICLFTDLHDKNGKEIYEGDIVQHKHKTKGEMVGTIIFERGTFMLDDPKAGEFNKMLFCCRMDLENWEVIGNIHELE